MIYRKWYTTVDNDRMLWLNEKHIKKGFDHKTLWEITTKYHSGHRKHRYKLGEEPKKQGSKMFIDQNLAIKVIINCKTTSAHKFRTILRFKQYDIILTKEQSVLTKIMD